MHPWLWFGDSVQIATYPVVIVAAFCACTAILRRESLRSRVPVRQTMDAAIVGLLTGGIGARLFHVLVEAPLQYAQDPLRIISPFAGWTFYGGLIGGLLGVALVARWRALSPWRLLDIFAVAIPFGQALARLGCLAGGCCYGRLADWPFGEVPWAITVDNHGQIPPELLAVPLHPAPLYLSLFNLLLFVGLSRLRARKPAAGVVFATLLLSYGVGRALLEVFRGDSERGPWFGDVASSAQLTSVLVAGLGLGLLLRW